MLAARLGRIGGSSLLLLASLLLGSLAHAAPARAPELPAGKAGLSIPEPLRPYVGWVLYDKETELCPFLYGESDDRRCVWPAELSLNLTDRGGRFVQRFRVYKKDWVPLPGDGKVWPQGVTVDGRPAVVATPGEAQAKGDDTVPQVLLNPGDHTVAGSFIWDEMPESLAVPQATGLLSLVVRGARLPLPSRDDDGRVWLQKEATEKEEEVLVLTVHRRLVDEVPPLLTTRIELRVSGKSREVLLGRTLPAGFAPLSLEGPLPARLESDSRLRVQVRAGTFVLTLVARLDGKHEKTLTFKRPSPEGPWPEDEVWVFEARPALRVATVDGVPLVDPQQTTLPEDWKRLPCYPMRLTDTMQLVEQRGGDADPTADQLILSRSLWLDFDGAGYTVSDHITGLLHRAWRLEVNPPMELGRVAVGGADQYISRLGSGGKPGVELRQTRLDISADSRLVPPHRGELPVVGWNADFHQVEQMTLHLPPGWHLFHATGADGVEGTWVERFTRLNVFLLLITAIAVGRLYGVLWGLLTLLMLGVALTESEAPRWAWLAVLGAEALVRLVPEGKARSVLRAGRLLALIVLGYLALTFAQQQMRSGLYPTLEQPDHFIGKEQSEEVPDWLKKRRHFDEESGMAKKRPRARAPSGAVERDDDGVLDQSDRAEASGGKMGKKDKFAIKRPPEAPKAEPDMKSMRVQVQKVAEANGIRASSSMSMAVNEPSYQQQNNLQQLDPNAVVQTGPGVPRWNWNVATLSFSGPVQRDQQLRLWLVPPSVNSGLALLRLILLTLLVLRLILRSDRGLKPSTPATTTAAMLLVIAGTLSVPGTARAELPSQEMLDTLRERLLEPPACHPHCASSSRMVLDVQPRSLRARMEVGAAANTAVPLPGGAKQWLPERVLIDGRPAPALLRSDDGKLWLEVNEGSHQVILEGPLPSRETVQIALPLKPHRVEANVKGWRLDGLHEDGEADDDLQLSRVQGNEADAPSGLQAGTLPPFVRIERQLTIGLKWEVQTRVVRMTPTGAAVVLEVPLLPGESVTTPDVRVQAGKALVNMAPGATELSWHSLLQEKPEIALQAPSGLPWTEVWRLEVAPIWHLEMSGIPPVQPAGQSERRPEFRPWPGEQLRIMLRRPDGVAGSSLTIDHSKLDVRPGLRATDATLTVGMRSSRGGQHAFTLPEGAVLEELKIGDENQPPRQEGRKVTLPLSPGAREVMLRWRQSQGLSTVFYTPVVDLGVPSVNATLVLRVLDGRWTLWTGRAAGSGPVVAPVVLFYSYLPVILLLSLLLSRLGLTPLRAHHFMLLGLGFTQLPAMAALLFLGWLLALGVRERYQVRSYRLFDLLQIALVFWSALAMLVLAVAVRDGLLGNPKMQISGNQSSGTLLRYFLDHSTGTLPVAFVVTVPMMFYRVAMLLWALWLAAALLRWLRWGFAAFGKGGMWKSAPPKPKAAPATKKAAADDDAKADAKAQATEDTPVETDSSKTPVVPPPVAANPHGADDEPQDKEPTLPERDTMVKP